MAESRSEKRMERYSELKALGFSPSEARRLRDRSASNIQSAIDSERRRISRKSRNRRSSAEQFRLDRIRARDVHQNHIRQRARLESRQERWRNFSEWTSSGFPNNALRDIYEINGRAGRPRDDGFGFRMYYYMYVERVSDFEASELADRADSGIRYLTNRPLIPGRDNLRYRNRPPQEIQRSA